MQNAGWNLGVEVWQNDKAVVAAKCRRGTNWFGWSGHARVGTVSTTLLGDGEATLDFGNCWDQGVVKVYLNDKVVASAHKNTPSKTVSFNFHHGDFLRLRDEGRNSIIAINDITFRCSSGPGISMASLFTHATDANAANACKGWMDGLSDCIAIAINQDVLDSLQPGDRVKVLPHLDITLQLHPIQRPNPEINRNSDLNIETKIYVFRMEINGEFVGEASIRFFGTSGAVLAGVWGTLWGSRNSNTGNVNYDLQPCDKNWQQNLQLHSTPPNCNQLAISLPHLFSTDASQHANACNDDGWRNCKPIATNQDVLDSLQPGDRVKVLPRFHQDITLQLDPIQRPNPEINQNSKIYVFKMEINGEFVGQSTIHFGTSGAALGAVVGSLNPNTTEAHWELRPCDNNWQLQPTPINCNQVVGFDN